MFTGTGGHHKLVHKLRVLSYETENITLNSSGMKSGKAFFGEISESQFPVCVVSHRVGLDWRDFYPASCAVLLRCNKVDVN